MNRVSQICVNYKTKGNLSCGNFTLFLYSGLVVELFFGLLFFRLLNLPLHFNALFVTERLTS